MSKQNIDPGKRKAQHLLASEVLELVHGREEAIKTRKEHQMMRSPTIESLTGSAITNEEDLPQNLGIKRVVLPRSLLSDTPIARILYHAGLVATKSEGARLVAKGGVYIASEASKNDIQELVFSQVKAQQTANVISMPMAGLMVLRIGKWKVRVIEVVDDEEFERKGIDAPGWKESKERQKYI